MRKLSKKEYLLWLIDHMLANVPDEQIVAAESLIHPIDQDGNQVTNVPAERFELVITARIAPVPDNLNHAPPTPLETFLRQTYPELFQDI